jgi:hypothetical protein
MRGQSKLLILVLGTACQVENKLLDIAPHTIAGECNLESPPVVPDSEKPIAVCNSNRFQVAPLRESADLFGSDSYDPNGLDLIDYRWRLVERPSGSGSTMLDENSDLRTFTPDLAGDYKFELVVTNEECVQSDPCELSLQATPLEDVWIELSWAESGDDLDLHLLRNGGPFESELDCYYGNCVSDLGDLDWGQRGLLDDNPKLDLDDIDGVGPENINIQEPTSGEYTIVVHDYPGSEYYSDNIALVRVHLAGDLVFERSIVVTGEDTQTEVAKILWPSLEVQSLVD